jgi:tryptophan synthase alpha chain
MSRLTAALTSARAAGRIGFIPYLTAGDPDAETTIDLVLMLAEEGADVIELGVPFSDPLADGATNQRAAERALARGMTLAGTLDLAASVRARVPVPLVLFTYFNPIYRMGTQEFARRAHGAGVDGVLVTDLPPEESETYGAGLREVGIDPVFMIAPTSGPERTARIARAGRGFLYYVSRTGVTGERAELPAGLREDVTRLRLGVSLPVAVGFGLSRRAHVVGLTGAADAVVVGSALVRTIEEAGRSEAVAAARRLTRELMGKD